MDGEGGTAALDLPNVGEVERLVRAHGTFFLVTDRQGDIVPAGARELGLFYHDTRYLSHYALKVVVGQAVWLSTETAGEAYNQVDLMISDVDAGEFLDDPKNFLHIRRRQVLDGGLVEQITFTNFLTRGVDLEVRIEFGADFADIFEVRGARRPKRGIMHTPRVEGSTVRLVYDGLCGGRYESIVSFATIPSELHGDHATFELSIPQGEKTVLELRICPSLDAVSPCTPGKPFQRRVEALEHDAEAFRQSSTRIECDNGLFQGVLDQSLADLYALRVQFGPHTILGAGIPWFCAPFGRDALITAYEALTVNVDLAVDSLRTLAAFQGKKFDDRSEEEPGKIFHELRFGEMAKTGEIPHSPYYGSIDATPLFVVLADAVYKIAPETALLQELRPALIAALAWIDTRSENGTRPVSYERKGPLGLENQGWKDSRAGVSYPDGRRAQPPIALCEVQGYCADAYARGARLLSALGDEERAQTYGERAARMTELINRLYWMPSAGRYAYAIDGRGGVVPTVVSNIGHLLWSRVVPRERAVATAHTLLASTSFSGYGIRTLASEQPVYNPLSYHNGTIWPHDNALIAKGFANYDLGIEVAKVFEGLYQALAYFRDRRLPELFCGIGRRSGPVVRYPVAGSPQAWAAATPFLLLRAMLGLRPDAPHDRLVIRNPQLPRSIRRVELHRMRVGNALVSVRFRQLGGRCHVDHLDVTGGPLKTEIQID